MSDKPNILWLPHALNPAYAGVRLRCMLPVAALRKSGLAPCVTDGLPPTDQRFDVAVVQAKWLLDAAEDRAFEARVAALRDLSELGTTIIVDSFDNYFLNETGDPARQRRLQRYRQALHLADRFVVSSPGLVPLLAREVGQAAAIDVLGDPVEDGDSHRHYESLAQRWNPRRLAAGLRAGRLRRLVAYESRSRLQLLWFGNQGSPYAVGGMAELAPLLPVLAAANVVQPLHLRVVSNSRPRYEQLLTDAQFPHSYVDWHRLHFAGLLAQHDLVLIPNRPSDFTVAKSNNRLLLALAQGVPVMADALPDYAPWQAHFASSPWTRLPEVLAELPSWRERALAAQPLVMARYSLQAIARDWLGYIGAARARTAVPA